MQCRPTHLAAWSAVALTAAVAMAGDPPPARLLWRLEANAQFGLAHGLIDLRPHEGGLQIDGYAGGFKELSERLDVTLSVDVDGSGLRVQVAEQTGHGYGDIETATPIVAGSRVVYRVPAERLSEAYHVLWRADVLDGERCVRTVAYVARLTPNSGSSRVFDREDLTQAERAIAGMGGLGTGRQR